MLLSLLSMMADQPHEHDHLDSCNKRYVCVECGIAAEETYKQYSKGIIKLVQCVRHFLLVFCT